MRLYELNDTYDTDDPLRVGTTAVLSRIKSDIEDSAFKGDFKVKTLLGMLKDNDIDLSHEQLIELVKEEPWSNLISNIKGDRVVFRGRPQGDSDSQEKDDTEGTLKKMAKRSERTHQDELKEVSDETLISYLTKVDADSRKHPSDPSKRSAARRNKSVAGFNRAFNKLDSRPRKD